MCLFQLVLKEKNVFFDVYCGKQQMEMWFSEVCNLMDNDTRHPSDR